MIQIEIIEQKSWESFGFEQCQAIPAIGDHIRIDRILYKVKNVIHKFATLEMGVNTSIPTLEGERFHFIEVYVLEDKKLK